MGGMQQRLALREPDPEERVAAVMAAHGRALLRVAHHWSLCHDDALDAYQRGLEIFLRRASAVDPATEVAWLKVVIKHEALAIRRARSEGVSGEEPDLDGVPAATARSLDEVLAGGERIGRSAEALRSLKPDEARALMLKAEGLSYAEIGELCGWTYTKVNRAITEGRRRFMKVYAAIEAGSQCERFAPVLAALAAGTATSAQLVEVRPHLRHCLACRATVRELHMSRLRKMRLLLPGFLLARFAAPPSSGEDALFEPDRIHIPGASAEAPFDGQLSFPIDPGPVVDVLPPPPPEPPLEIPHMLDLGGAQLTIPLDVGSPVERGWGFGRVKDEALALLHRSNSSDVAAGIHIATVSGGGGRISTVATIIGFCVSGAGAGALCVATGVVTAPSWMFEQRADPPRPGPHADPRERRARTRSDNTSSSREVVAIQTPAPTPTPTPVPRLRRPAERDDRVRRASDPSQRTGPRSHEHVPISEAPQGTTSEFSPEQSAPATPPNPNPAPQTGGSEFLP